MSNQTIEIPHEVETHLRQARAQHRLGDKYVAESNALFAKHEMVYAKAGTHYRAAGMELIGARDQLRELEIIPPGPGNFKKQYPATWEEVLARICTDTFSVDKAKRCMVAHGAPDKAEEAAEKDRLRKQKERMQAAAYRREQERKAEHEERMKQWEAEAPQRKAREAEQAAQRKLDKKAEAAQEKRDVEVEKLYEAVDALVEKFGTSITRIRQLATLIRKITL